MITYEKTTLHLEDEEENKKNMEIGGGVPPLPRLAPGGLMHNYLDPELATKAELEIPIRFKLITRKRFIKLVMSRGYQRNEAEKIHNEYMLKLGTRTRIGMEVFLASRDNPRFQIFVGGIDYGKAYDTNVMGKFNTTTESEDRR